MYLLITYTVNRKGRLHARKGSTVDESCNRETMKHAGVFSPRRPLGDSDVDDGSRKGEQSSSPRLKAQKGGGEDEVRANEEIETVQ